MLFEPSLALSAVIFVVGMIGLLSRRNLLIVLMSLELMLNGINLSLVAFSYHYSSMAGQVFVLFIIAVAAVESVTILAIIFALYRRRREFFVDKINLMKW